MEFPSPESESGHVSISRENIRKAILFTILLICLVNALAKNKPGNVILQNNCAVTLNKLLNKEKIIK